MASVIYHTYNQLKSEGKAKLFKHGEQKRDFIYVEDVCSVILWMMQNKPQSGIYNVGTGKAREFNDLVKAVIRNTKPESEIEYIDIPKSIEFSYQSYTKADISKLRRAGYDKLFHTLEEGIEKYVDYLKRNNE